METKDILKSLRKSNGYSTMQEFCAAADISFSTYQNYESGKRVPTAEILVKLADFYGVTTDYLLGRPEAKAPADLIRAVAAERQLTSAQQGILAAYLYMDSRDREKLVEYIRQFAAAAEKADAPEGCAAMTCGEVEDFREAQLHEKGAAG